MKPEGNRGDRSRAIYEDCARHGPCSARAIAERLAIDPSYVYWAMQDGMRKGLQITVTLESATKPRVPGTGRWQPGPSRLYSIILQPAPVAARNLPRSLGLADLMAWYQQGQEVAA